MKRGSQLLHAGQGVVPEQRVHGHDDTRGAEAALRPVGLDDPLLQHTGRPYNQQPTFMVFYSPGYLNLQVKYNRLGTHPSA